MVMPLSVKTENVVEVQDWNNLVVETYGRPYHFQQQEGCKPRGVFRLTVPDEASDFENESVPEEINGDEMGVSFAAWLERDPAAAFDDRTQQWDIDLFWARNFYPDVQMVANDLHRRGEIEAGEYTINIDW